MLPFIEDLVRKVLCSFTNTLLLLNTDNDVSTEVPIPKTVKDVPSFSKCPNPQHTDEVCKEATIDALTNMTRAVQQSNRFREFKKILHCTRQHIMVIKCKSSSSSDIVMESATPSGSSVFLSFSNTLPTKEQYQLKSCSLSSSTKQEPVEVIQDELLADHSPLALSDYLLLCDYELDFNYMRHVTTLF
ncbi:hypothetical protein V8G54_026435 [Vigna mungo]|uniref:Uncharacterized protein n=1 Tax=Vigna mungo TaxID=3915 RepID=A0AAQ3N113_VIGMU